MGWPGQAKSTKIGREPTMKSIAVATLALLAASPALAQQGVSRDRDRRRHRAGPVRADRLAVQARRERHAHADRRDQRGRRRQRPQAAARGGGPRLRSEEGRARRAEAGAAGQDLRRDRLDRHPDRDGGDADLSRQQGRAPVSAHRRAPDVRAAARPEVLVLGALLRPDPRRHEARHQGQGPEEGLRDLPGRRLRRRKCCRAASRRSRTSA